MIWYLTTINFKSFQITQLLRKKKRYAAIIQNIERGFNSSIFLQSQVQISLLINNEDRKICLNFNISTSTFQLFLFSFWDAGKDVFAREGILGLYRGCSPTLLRTFVGQAVALTAYARSLSWFTDEKYSTFDWCNVKLITLFREKY